MSTVGPPLSPALVAATARCADISSFRPARSPRSFREHALGAWLPCTSSTVALGIGLIGASFMLSWAADAVRRVSPETGRAGRSLVGSYPELTSKCNRLHPQLTSSRPTYRRHPALLTGATALPLLPLWGRSASKQSEPPILLAPSRYSELGIRFACALFAVQIIIR